MPFILLAVVAALLIAGIVALAQRERIAVNAGLSKMRGAHGAARCIAAQSLVARLAAGGSSARIAQAWPELEPLLLEALPDCPPDLKRQLADDLANCSAACRVREIARGLMTLRNSLV